MSIPHLERDENATYQGLDILKRILGAFWRDGGIEEFLRSGNPILGIDVTVGDNPDLSAIHIYSRPERNDDALAEIECRAGMSVEEAFSLFIFALADQALKAAEFRAHLKGTMIERLAAAIGGRR